MNTTTAYKPVRHPKNYTILELWIHHNKHATRQIRNDHKAYVPPNQSNKHHSHTQTATIQLTTKASDNPQCNDRILHTLQDTVTKRTQILTWYALTFAVFAIRPDLASFCGVVHGRWQVAVVIMGWRLRGTVVCVVGVKYVADIAEQTWRGTSRITEKESVPV